MSVHAYQAYRQTQVSTASQGELLIMLYDGALR
ncbi:MAG TPA: flagellar protein FliS, partial [Firmicutes bacterium]|nr:flagellar protein FliS [Bacillota bacterium]